MAVRLRNLLVLSGIRHGWGPAQEIMSPAVQPILDDLAPTDAVVLTSAGMLASVGWLIQVNVPGGLKQVFQCSGLGQA